MSPRRNRSPWIEALEPDTTPRPLTADTQTDVAVIGAGIAGISTAFFTLRESDASVLLLERNRVGRGASGHNAGQLVSYFERPLGDLVDAYGFDLAIAAQRGVDGAHDLLDEMLAAAGVAEPIERFIGYMGMFTLNHVLVHLRNIALRQRGGLRPEYCLVSREAPFLSDIPAEYHGLYNVVSQAEVRRLVGTPDDRYCAVLANVKGCANSALACQQVLAHLEQAYPGRFQYADHTLVGEIVVGDDDVRLEANGHVVTAAHAALCTNGFTDHAVVAFGGDEVFPSHHRVHGDVGYMVGFYDGPPTPAGATSYIRNQNIGEDVPYLYSTRRPTTSPDGPATLMCIGGPETLLDDRADYDSTAPFPEPALAEFDNDVRPMLYPERADGDYDFTWHGLMAYTDSQLRLIGPEPRQPRLLYNLGCNGVGFLPSIYGGHRLARLIGGEQLEPSIFDPATDPPRT
jgi:glycine/D-amino acid oxidase-like deaminating enzyme